MVYRLLAATFICLATLGCVEKYDFSVPPGNRDIVIEAEISNKSFRQTREDYPSLGRYFKTILSYTGDVSEMKGSPISDAKVELVSEDGTRWSYTEDSNEPGTYYLFNDIFSAEYGNGYRIEISTADKVEINSSWEYMPEPETTVGQVYMEEVEYKEYKYWKSNKRRLESFVGIDLKVSLNGSDSERQRYYRWAFDPMYIYEAALAAPQSLIKRCWVHDPYYLKGFQLEEEKKGKYSKDLFRMPIKSNEKAYVYFSTLVNQYSMTEDYYYFWKSIEAQRNKGGLFDNPPFNVETNYTCNQDDIKVHGYFGVVAENAKRWVLDPSLLSFQIKNDLLEICSNIYSDPPFPTGPRPCLNCLDYGSYATTSPPHWW